MTKSFRRNLIGGIGFVVALAAGGVTTHAETPLERGTYLMQSVAACANCHTPKGPQGDVPGMELAGMENLMVTPGFTAHAPNITPDIETGIGAWTDAQLIAAIRDGVRPDGTIIGPPMPIALYRGLSDRDVEAIVAYIRAVPAIRNAVPGSVYNMPLPPSYGPPVVSVADVPSDDPVVYGAYLAGPVAHCVECHSPMGDQGPDWQNRAGAGGLTFDGPWGQSVSANLTPTGLSDYSDDEIKSMIRTGVHPDGHRLMPPMGYAYYAGMKEEDMNAIVAYLRQLPAR